MGLKAADIVDEDRNNPVSIADAECPTRQEIVLDVCNEQCVMRTKRDHGSSKEFDAMLDSRSTCQEIFIRLLSLLRQKTNVRHEVLHFSIGELATPRMHRAVDDAVLDGPQ